MEDLLKDILQVTSFKKLGNITGGHISEATAYMADGKKVFVKTSSDDKAGQMFTGECESLKRIRETSTVYVPETLLVENYEGTSCIVMEFLELEELSAQASTLGHQLARLHLHNIEMEKIAERRIKFVGSCDEQQSFVDKFGFHVLTYCGKYPQSNEWADNWMNFYANRLDMHVKLIEENYNDRTVGELWSQLQLKLNLFFEKVDIKPSLLHGDMWIGNVGECGNKPVIFDPASFYGHHEYDLAIGALFGGFSKPFWSAYHKSIPKEDGWDGRHRLYKLFHLLNHWVHFGDTYKQSSLDSLRDLLK